MLAGRGWKVRRRNKRERRTDNLVYAKDGADVHTGVDVAATVEWVEDDAVFALEPVLDDDRLLELLGDEHCRLARGTQRIDHDVVREHIKLLLLLALDLCITGEADAVCIAVVRRRAPVTRSSGGLTG